MNNLLIQIPSDEKTKFTIYVTLLNPFVGVIENNKFKQEQLTDREIEILSLLCYYNKLYLLLPEVDRERYLHSNDIRKQIKAELDINTNNYNNVLGRLSNKVLGFNKQLLYNKGKINPMLAIDISSYEGIEFKFKHPVIKEQ